MSFSPQQQPRRPPRRPERTPSTDYIFSPSSPAAHSQSPRPGASPAHSRPVCSPAFSPEPHQSRASPAFSPSPRPVAYSHAPYSPASTPRPAPTPQPRFPFIDEVETPRSHSSPARTRPPPQEWMNPEPLPVPSPRSAYRDASPARHRGHGPPPLLLQTSSSKPPCVTCSPSPSVYSSSQGHARVSSHDAGSVAYGSTYDTKYSGSMESTTSLVVHAHPHEKMANVPLSPDPRASPPLASPPPAATSKSHFSTVTGVGIAEGPVPAPIPRSWAHTAQWTLIPALTLTTAVVAIVIGHSLGLYGGLKLGGSIDTSSNAHPTWPSNLNLLPSWLLLGVGAASCLITLVVWGFSLRRRFMQPVSWLEGFRIGAGLFFVAAWAVAAALFKVLETSDEGDSLGYWACRHQSEDIMGVHDYWQTCTEQNVGFALGITSAAIELLLMICFFVLRRANRDDGAIEKVKA